MRDDGLRIKVERFDYGSYIGMFIGKKDLDSGGFNAIAKVTFVNHEPDSCIPIQDALQLSDATAQVLMDDLWHIGIRPTQEGSAGQLSAVEKHLGDMRAIVSKELIVELPKGKRST